MSNYQLAIIGGGNMAEAVVRGVLAAGVLAAGDIIVSDPAAERRDIMVGLGLSATTDNRLAARSADRVLLAVKPQLMDAVLVELAGQVSPDTLIISIAAGISTELIEAKLAVSGGPNRDRKGADARGSLPLPHGRGSDNGRPAHRVIRVMPNTPMLVGAGMSGLARGAHATAEDVVWTRRLFDAAGRTVVLSDERLIDAVTAVSGSGPAYFFYLVEQMAAAGVAEGLSETDALALATQTCLGAGRLLTESAMLPAELRRRVTSPGGTTAAACQVLDDRGAAEAIRAAVAAAAARSRELG